MSKIIAIATAAFALFAAIIYELDKRSEHSVQKIYEQAAQPAGQD